MAKKGFDAEKAKKRLEKDAGKVTEKDIKRVVDKADKIEKKVKSSGALGKFFDDIKLMLSMVKDYWKKEYTSIPWSSLAAIVAALIYVFSPIDLIPDFIPVIGLIDDAAVVAACLALVRFDIDAYREWKASQELNGYE